MSKRIWSDDGRTKKTHALSSQILAEVVKRREGPLSQRGARFEIWEGEETDTSDTCRLTPHTRSGTEARGSRLMREGKRGQEEGSAWGRTDRQRTTTRQECCRSAGRLETSQA